MTISNGYCTLFLKPITRSFTIDFVTFKDEDPFVAN
jgi:hypothetical protein